MRLFFHKLTHWEYWPYQVVYIPIYFLWAYYALRTRTIFFFNSCNPSIKNGGFIAESKKEIYDLIPPEYYPKTERIATQTPFESVMELLEKSGLQFPFIAKPDIGLRGSAVKKIDSMQALKDYHGKADFDFLIQDLIPYSQEIGIFYVRFPHQDKGRITGIVAKEFLIVEGDGHSTILALLQKDPRYALQIKALQKEYADQLLEILPQGEQRNLVPYGNHARGAKFIDASHKITPQLTQVIDQLCQRIPGFYFGRLDVMYNSWAQIEAGTHFAIVELNGAGSEPTHIYDPRHSIFFAWKELARHIGYMYKISVANHRLGFPYLSHKEGMRQFRLHQAQCNKIVHF